jgi:imidazole glycerol-phosphate synthase subunit HisH
VKRVAVVDYGVSNLDSVVRALEECGAAPFVADDPAELKNAGLMVLPGVGAFADGMRNLRERGLHQALLEQVLERGVPLLGVCLGMQLLADRGSEGGATQGLGLIPGSVVKLHPDAPGTRIPHVGWNEVHPTRPSELLEGIGEGRDFYFVHSYHLECDDAADLLATTPYCGGIASVVQRGIVAGVQFHPEKSQKAGFALLRNFVGG